MNTYSSPSPGLIPRVQFSLDTLFLVTTLVAVCLGLLMTNPAVGIVATIIFVPALLRTFADCIRRQQSGLHVSRWEKIGAFNASVCATALAMGSSLVLFFLFQVVHFAAHDALRIDDRSPIPGTLSTIIFCIFTGLGLLASMWLFLGVYWGTLPARRR